MQALIPLIATLSVVSGRLIIPPHPDPDSVYQHYQNSKTGEYAYSYVGDSSAKEETKDAEGVTRGSYNYVDSNGNLQYTLYVADKDGFRVAATDLPHGYNLAKPDLFISGLPVLSVTASNLEKPSQDASNQQPIENPSQVEQAEKVKPASPNKLRQLFPPATSFTKLVRLHSNVKFQPTEFLVKISGDEILPLFVPPSGLFEKPTDLPLVLIPSEVQDLGNPQEDAKKENPLDLGKRLQLSYLFNRNPLDQQLSLEGPNLTDMVVTAPPAAAKDTLPASKEPQSSTPASS